MMDVALNKLLAAYNRQDVHFKERVAYTFLLLEYT